MLEMMEAGGQWVLLWVLQSPAQVNIKDAEM